MPNSKARTIAKYVIPTILSQVCFFLFSVVDAVFIGRGIGTNALGAINIVGPFIMIINAINMIINIGGVSICAIRVGKRDLEGANNVFRHSIVLTFLFAVLFTIGGVFFPGSLCRLLGASETFYQYAVDYMFWYSIFIIPSVLSVAFQNFCRNDNAPGLVSKVVAITTACNIFGDWLLIYPIPWGTKGAAIATGVSQTIGFIMMLTHFIRKRGSLSFGTIKLDAELIKEMVIRGLPEGVSQLAAPMMTFCMNTILIQKVGDFGVTAFSVIVYIASFSMAIFIGASSGLQPLFGQSYGAKNVDDLHYYFKSGLKISILGSFIVTILAVLFGKYICQLFGTDAVTQEYVIKVLPQFAVGFIAMAINVMISSYLYSTERSGSALCISVLRSLVMNVAVILILPKFFGEGIIWFSLLIYEAIVLIIAITLLKRSEKDGLQFKE